AVQLIPGDWESEYTLEQFEAAALAPDPEPAKTIDRTQTPHDPAAGEPELVTLFKAAGLYLEPAPDGGHYVECPRKAEHRVDSGPTQTRIYVDGDGREGFNCFHGHDAWRAETGNSAKIKINHVRQWFKEHGIASATAPPSIEGEQASVDVLAGQDILEAVRH